MTDRGVAKIDVISREIWLFETRAHHNLWGHDDGSVFVLSPNKRMVPGIPRTRAIFDEKSIQISLKGEKSNEVSLLDVIRDSGHSYLLSSVGRLDNDAGDIDTLHAKYVEVLDGRLSSM